MDIAPPLEQKLREIVRTFLRENELINLSALRTEEKCWNGNVLDSLPLLELSQIVSPAKNLIDIGSGGGFPLLPLAAALPHVRCVGLDSIAKKMDAVKRIAQASGLNNVETAADRAEVAAHRKEHRERYDIVTARAVAEIPVLLEYCAAFVNVGGVVVLWKSMHAEEEIRASESAQRTLGCVLEARHRYALPGDWGERQLLVFRKKAPLPKLYPREVGMAKKKPL